MVNIAISKTLELRGNYDVVVAGGGTAGVFAAVAAAMGGAKTLLVEKNGILGGTITAGYVNYPGIFNFWGRQLITGPAWELMCELAAEGEATMPSSPCDIKHFSKQQIKIDVFCLAAALDRVCASHGVEIKLHTMVSFADENNYKTDGGILVGLTGKEGLYAVIAKKIIDATGDANVTGMMGYKRVRNDVLQPATYENRLEGYRIEDIREEDVNSAFAPALENGELDPRIFSWKSPYSMLKAARANIHIPCNNAETSDEKTAMELAGRRILHKMLQIYRTVPGCSGIRVKVFAYECGIRETYRIVGEKTMTIDNYMSGYVYDDAVSYCFYPVDVHRLDGIYNLYHEKGIVPTIPYGALIPRGAHHLLIAGRTVSSDTETNSAVRVQAPCMSMGQVAGTAAAIAAKHSLSVQQINFCELTRELQKIGATVPEK
jgi:hypothetical protein